ncbi:MAG: uroporphyrinogen decarboxylase family protein [Candidatus Xenobiia bacterium LiM19]
MMTTGIDTLKSFIEGTSPPHTLASFWGHFYKAEQHWETLLEATIGFQKEFRWDFVKINPSSTFFVEDWGNRYEKYDNQRSHMIRHAVRNAADLKCLRRLEPGYGLRGDNIKLIKALKSEMPGTPLIMTLFNPLSYARRLCGTSENLLTMIESAPDLVEQGLEIISSSIAEYGSACLEAGCHGFFYATTEWGSLDLMSREQYSRFSSPYDRQILNILRDKSLFLILHVCQSNNRLKDLLDYPVDSFSWDWKDTTNPSFGEILKSTSRILTGGISHTLLEDPANYESIRKEVEEFRSECPERSVLAPGCTFNCANTELLHRIRELLQKSDKKDTI